MLTLSDSKGTGGVVKAAAEDFIVKEITQKGYVLNPGEKYTAMQLDEAEDKDGKFTTFVLQKTNWDTVNALIRISKLTGHGKKSIGYAGTKDKQSVSVQLAAIYGVDPDRMMGVRLKDISINGAWKSNGIEMGSNIGNAFTVRIKRCSTVKPLEDTISQLDGRAPNYFDRQRFGARMNNPAVGMLMLKGDFEGAVMEFLTSTKLEKSEEAVEARNRLKESQDFKEALQYFPKYLKNERSVIEYMSKYDNHANSLRKLPRGILIMFIHSVQSLIFNAALEQRIKDEDLKSSISCTKNFYGFPDIGSVSAEGDFPLGNIVGYETKQEVLHEYEKDVMEHLDLTTGEFKIKSMPELSMKGSVRTLMMPLKNLSYDTKGKDILLDFSIPSGSYATIFLNEITKSDSFSLTEVGLLK